MFQFLFLTLSNNAIGIAHAGWQGTSKNVAGTLVNAMQSKFNSKPGELLAAIGPAICREHYQVGQEVIDAIQADYGQSDPRCFFNDQMEISHIDLKKCNEIQLFKAGVCQVENSGNLHGL